MSNSHFWMAFIFVTATQAWAQSAVVDVSLTPAGSFKAKSADVRGYAIQNGNTVEAKNIMVSLRNIQTGIGLRDTHTKKYLEVEKYADAVLVSAKGADGKGTGTIRIKGIERQIAGTYQVSGNQLTATFPLKLSDFKIEHVKYMGVGVDDDVNLTVVVPVKK